MSTVSQTAPAGDAPAKHVRAKRLVECNNAAKALKLLMQQAPLAATDVAGRLKEKVICEALHDIQLPDKNRTTTVYSITQAIRCVKKLKQGKSPSTGMAKAEHLKPLAYRAAQAPIAVDLLTVLVNMAASGDLPQYLQEILLADAEC